MTAKKTKQPYLDWYGNPIEGVSRGICSGDSRHFIMGEIESDGTRYLRVYTSGGAGFGYLSASDLGDGKLQIAIVPFNGKDEFKLTQAEADAIRTLCAATSAR